MIRRGLPLQPTLSPWPAWARRGAVLAAASAAILALGLAAPGRAAPVRIVLSGPGHALDYAREARRLIDGAGERIRVVVYVVRVDEGPVRDLLQALADAVARGVDVRVCLDYGAKFDDPAIDPKHEAPAAWLQAKGVTVVLDEEDRTTHAKVLVVDRRHVLLGSHNWTASALTRNREAAVVLDDPTLAEELEVGLFATIPGME